MSKFTTVLLCVVLSALAAGVAVQFFGSTEVDAAPVVAPVVVSVPTAPQPSSLELGLDGLPQGSVKFYVDGAVCVAVPDVGVTCFCPCDGDICSSEVVEAPVVASSYAVTVTASYTAGASTGTVMTTEVPSTSVSDTPDTPDVPVDDTPDAPADDAPDVPADDTPDTPADDKPKGNNGLGNGVDPAPPGIDKQGKPQNDDPATPGDPQYKGSGSDGKPNGKGGKSEAPGQSKDKDKGKSK